MSEPFVSEIKLVAFNFAPRGYALCNGQLLPINQNQALFSLLGTTFGGNGTTNFALPDLRSRTPLHMGTGPGLPNYVMGQVSGEETHAITVAELPTHTHFVTTSSNNSDLGLPTANFFGGGGLNAFSNTPDLQMSGAAISTGGGAGLGHDNMQPYLAVNMVIALVGIYPSRN